MPFQLVKQLEQERGDLRAIIPVLASLHGQVEAGRRLGLSVATINKWLKAHGYRKQVDYITLEQARRELAALRDVLTYGPDGGAVGADMLALAARADYLAALIKRLEAAEQEKSA